MTVKTRRADEMVEGESPLAQDIMAKAPLVLELDNASVVVERVSSVPMPEDSGP